MLQLPEFVWSCMLLGLNRATSMACCRPQNAFFCLSMCPEITAALLMPRAGCNSKQTGIQSEISIYGKVATSVVKPRVFFGHRAGILARRLFGGGCLCVVASEHAAQQAAQHHAASNPQGRLRGASQKAASTAGCRSPKSAGRHGSGL